MRVLIDLTNSPHVPVFAPLIRLLREDGHDVVVSARRFAQTVELAAMHNLDATIIGEHGGGGRFGKARAAAQRTTQLLKFARKQQKSGSFDVAFSHGSTDLPIVCRLLRIPHVTMFDYEWAATMHRLNCRASWKVVTPDMIPASRLSRYGAAVKLAQYPGLKEEYYMHDTAFDGEIRSSLGISENAVLTVLRPPPELALYHRDAHNTVFDDVIDRLGSTEGTATVILPRTDEQRDAINKRLAGENFVGNIVVPTSAIDAQSLVADADLVVSAGGTMNREAVALGVPVYTVFAGRMGAVDEHLIAQKRLLQLKSADDLKVVTRDRSGELRTNLRDPRTLLDLLLSGLPTSN